uniref:Uncharacterized protein n=1 Tax=Arsenophonus nasoniae TaxID=638 RepID=D2TX96_9GAMM|nr:hypothetical protein ARN_07090 [Arsenophonus nasoniae]
MIRNRKVNPINFRKLLLLSIKKRVIKRIVKVDICGNLASTLKIKIFNKSENINNNNKII